MTQSFLARRIWVLLAMQCLVVTIGLVAWILAVMGGHPDLIVNGVLVEGSQGALVVIGYALGAISQGALGSLIAARAPGNRIGPILMGIGGWSGLTLAANSVSYLMGVSQANQTWQDFSHWLGNWSFVPSIIVPMTIVLMLVPDGRLPSPRWRAWPWLAGLGTAAWMSNAAFYESLGVVPRLLPNPFHQPLVVTVTNWVLPVLAVALVASALSIYFRYRQADRGVRQQLKWIAFGGAVVISVQLLAWLVSVAWPLKFGLSAIATATLVSLILPLAIAVAIIRYKLYSVDRIISRTVTYGLVAGFLAGTYGFLTIGLPRFLGLSGDSPQLVAGATLAVFALFAPARRRIQQGVERQFNRAHYDARAEIELLSSRLAHGAEMSSIVAATMGVLDRTVQPEHVRVWIRERVVAVP